MTVELVLTKETRLGLQNLPNKDENRKKNY